MLLNPAALTGRLRFAALPPRSSSLRLGDARRRKCTTTTHASPISDVSVFLEEIAVAQTPKRLGSLLRVLEAQGGRGLPPTDRAGLHPFLIPLCEVGSAAGLPASAKGEIACLLRWPVPAVHRNMPMPLVTMVRGAKKVRLLSRSVNEHLHRTLAEEDITASSAGGARPLTEAAGPECEPIYAPGRAEAAGFGGPKAALYVVSKAGYFPDICEGLAYKHLSKGDKLSALVASEWYMRNDFFPGWARPYEFGAQLLAEQKRDEEARDLARVAMRFPWWTLESDFPKIQELAHLSGKSPEETRYLLSEEAAVATSVQTQGQTKEVKSPQQTALMHSEALLDYVAAGKMGSYDEVRPELAQAYREAGLSDMANFIIATS